MARLGGLLHDPAPSVGCRCAPSCFVPAISRGCHDAVYTWVVTFVEMPTYPPEVCIHTRSSGINARVSRAGAKPFAQASSYPLSNTDL